MASFQIGNAFSDRFYIVNAYGLKVISKHGLDGPFPAFGNVQRLRNTAVILKADAFEPFLNTFFALAQRCFLQCFERRVLALP